MDNKTIRKGGSFEVPEGEIVIPPRIIYWIGPPHLTKEDIINVLQKDLLIIPCDAYFTSFHHLKNAAHHRNVYFFNLDHITRENHIRRKHFKVFTRHLSGFFNTLTPAKCLVYGERNRSIFEPAFASHHIPFRESLLCNKHTLEESIHIITRRLFKKPIRATYRLSLLPLKYSIKAIVRDSEHGITLNGYIKDLSLNGVGFILDNQNMCTIQENTKLTLYLSLNKKIVQINSNELRINDKKTEIGVWYDINKKEFISEEHRNILLRLMYAWLKQVVYPTHLPLGLK